jgi:uncharacterized protein
LAGEWPIDQLDVTASTAGGWSPTPFRQVILKLHSRCDLACDYCFIYQMGDSTWRSRPPVITSAVVERTVSRIAEHCRAHGLADFSVVLHGGEPLLAGPDVIRTVAEALRSRLPSRTSLDLRLQTNGGRLDRNMLDLLLDLDIKVGVSLDGNEQQHNRHRRTARGKGSYERTAQALRLLSSERYRSIYGGLLCVIDIESDPLDTYEALLSFDPPVVDFLLPHGNWTTPPPGRPANGEGSPYGDWLVMVFDRWYATPKRETGIRTFQEIITMLLGGVSRTESIGLSPVALLVVDTDGSLEQVDALRSVHHGAAATGLTVFDQDLDTLLSHPAIAARQIGTGALAQSCLSCPIHRVCGGGYYPHRYRRGDGFRNPSVYCPDLTRLINHIAGRMRSDIANLLEPTS